MADEYVVIVTATIEDGSVARWYIHEAAAENGYELMSASRNGVLVHTYLHNIPEPLLAAATQAWKTLRADRNANIRHLATHRHKYLLGREVEPVPRKPDVDAGRVPEAGGET